ncbi:hypothetical protein D3C72_1932070 [compost metagenome]
MDTIDSPAYSVMPNATHGIHSSLTGSLLSITSQTKPATNAAAAGLGKPWKKRLSTTPMLALKRASRSAAQVQ